MISGEAFRVPPWSRLERPDPRTTGLPVHKRGPHMRPTSWLPDTGKRRTAEWRTRKPICSQAVASLAVIRSPFRLCPHSVGLRTQRECRRVQSVLMVREEGRWRNSVCPSR